MVIDEIRVLHLLSSTGYHGAENMAAELIHQLAALGIKSYVGVFDNNRNSNTDILKVVQPFIEDGVIFPCHGKLDMRTVFSLRKYATGHNIDIIHSHKYKTNFYSLLASFRTKWKLASTCHNWLGNSFNMRFYANLDKCILRGFDAVVGVSDEVTGELKKYLTNSKIKKIENGIDISKYSRLIEKDEAKKILGLEGRQVIGFVGRLSADKGISYLLQAVRRLVDTGHDLYALIVGDGDNLSALQAEAHSLGIADRVIFTGKREDTHIIYSALDLFVLPSLKEAFPMVILEAMASGVPIVACHVGDIPLILENNVSGLIIEPKEVNALAQSIGELLLNRDRAEQLAKMAREKVQNYSSILMALKYQAIYDQVLGH